MARKSKSRLRDTVAYARPDNLPGVETLRASFTSGRFARHFHECYAFGVIDRGALGFRYMGEHVVAPAGSVNLVVPGEPHTGQAETENGWSYRMFYLDPGLLRDAAHQLNARTSSLPHFTAGVLHDPLLAGLISQVHIAATTPGTPRMAQESGILQLLTAWITRHSVRPPQPPAVRRAPKTVDRIRDLIQDRCTEDLSLSDLAAHAGLSPFHLVRTFTAHVGMPPREFLIQCRIRRAEQMLKTGTAPISDIALDLGFADQSHFTRHFKRFTGLTPALLRA